MKKEDIICPKCNGKMTITGEYAYCSGCGEKIKVPTDDGKQEEETGNKGFWDYIKEHYVDYYEYVSSDDDLYDDYDDE